MTERSNVVQSVDRALHLMEALAVEPQGCRLRDVAGAVGLASSTAHRLLTTLQQREFVRFDPGAATWRIGRMAFRVGATFARHRAFLVPASPMMRRLRDASGETVNIGEPADGRMTILAQAESREVVRVINVVGGTVPLSSSALGKAVLATYSDDALQVHIARHGLPGSTARTLTDPAALRLDLAHARNRGWATDREEHFLGLHCVAAPVFDATGDAVAAISISGLAGRMDAARLAEMGPLAIAAAAELTRAIEGRAPPDWTA